MIALEGQARGKAEGRAEGKAELVLRSLTLRLGRRQKRRAVAAATSEELDLIAERVLSASTEEDVLR